MDFSSKFMYNFVDYLAGVSGDVLDHEEVAKVGEGGGKDTWLDGTGCACLCICVRVFLNNSVIRNWYGGTDQVAGCADVRVGGWWLGNCGVWSGW